MTTKLEDMLTDDERLDLWAEMMALATAMQEYCDWWWQLDKPMRQANHRRCHVDDDRQLRLPNISD